MVIAEDGSFGAWIARESRLRVVHGRGLLRNRCWGFVGTGEAALAVPSVAWTVFCPELVIDGTNDPPERRMVGTRMDGG